MRNTYKGFEYLIWKNPRSGTYCAYIKLPTGHMYYGADEDDIDLQVHGGITFTKQIDVHHLELDDRGFTPGYWIGWDYAHGGDYLPEWPELSPKGGHKWTAAEVEAECKGVIDQLIAVQKS